MQYIILFFRLRWHHMRSKWAMRHHRWWLHLQYWLGWICLQCVRHRLLWTLLRMYVTIVDSFFFLSFPFSFFLFFLLFSSFLTFLLLCFCFQSVLFSSVFFCAQLGRPFQLFMTLSLNIRLISFL